MGRNIEIKAAARDFARQKQLAAAMATSGPTLLRQHDSFYRVPRGRLKLRRFGDGHGELIQYDRADTADAKTSQYLLAPVNDVPALHACLERALGVLGEVRKLRTLYMAGRTRIHFDEVEGLGAFIELEVVLEDGEAEGAGEAEAKRIMQQLEISEQDLVPVAYVDLLSGADPSRWPRR